LHAAEGNSVVQIKVYQASQQFPIHSDWQSKWCDGFIDWKLKDEIWNNPRFSGRIGCDLLEQFFECGSSLEKEFPQVFLLDELLERPQHSFLSQIGMAWYAPALAPLVPIKAERQKLGISSREQMREILAFQHHTPVESLGEIPDANAFFETGLDCVFAWLEDLPKTVSSRVKLLFPYYSGLPGGKKKEKSEVLARLINAALESQGGQ